MSQFRNDNLAMFDTRLGAEMVECTTTLYEGVLAGETPDAEVVFERLASGGVVAFIRPDPTLPAEAGAYVCVFKNEDTSFSQTQEETRRLVESRFGQWPMELSMAFLMASTSWRLKEIFRSRAA